MDEWNTAKTEQLLISPDSITPTVGTCFDQEMLFDQHCRSLTHLCLCHLMSCKNENYCVTNLVSCFCFCILQARLTGLFPAGPSIWAWFYLLCTIYLWVFNFGFLFIVLSPAQSGSCLYHWPPPSQHLQSTWGIIILMIIVLKKCFD